MSDAVRPDFISVSGHLAKCNPEQLRRLKQGSIQAWNAWRDENWEIPIELCGAQLQGAELANANLAEVDLAGADLRDATLDDVVFHKAHLGKADLRGAKTTHANFDSAYLSGAKLHGLNLRGALIADAQMHETELPGADLSDAFLTRSNLTLANLQGATLHRTYLEEAKLHNTNLTGADLTGANLTRALLIGTDIEGACFSGCRIYGISAWDLRGTPRAQDSLVITKMGASDVTADNLRVAHFVYLIMTNDHILDVIETIGRKAVLILGRFGKRKAILDSMREALRRRDYLPIIFDFPPSATQTTMRTVSTLAHMARFVIADLSDATSVLGEIQKVAPALPGLPIQLLLDTSYDLPPMSDSFLFLDNVLPPFMYATQDALLAALDAHVIQPPDQKAAQFEAKLRRLRGEYVPWQLER